MLAPAMVQHEIGFSVKGRHTIQMTRPAHRNLRLDEVGVSFKIQSFLFETATEISFLTTTH